MDPLRLASEVRVGYGECGGGLEDDGGNGV
jgi:hypothetical protein